METFVEGLKIWEAEQVERIKKEDKAWAALPQAEKDRINQVRKDRVEAEMQPHRVDLTDDDLEDDEEE